MALPSHGQSRFTWNHFKSSSGISSAGSGLGLGRGLELARQHAAQQHAAQQQARGIKDMHRIERHVPRKVLKDLKYLFIGLVLVFMHEDNFFDQN